MRSAKNQRSALAKTEPAGAEPVTKKELWIYAALIAALIIIWSI